MSATSVLHLHVGGTEITEAEMRHINALGRVRLGSGIEVVDVATIATWEAIGDKRFGAAQRDMMRRARETRCQCSDETCGFKQFKVEVEQAVESN